MTLRKKIMLWAAAIVAVVVSSLILVAYSANYSTGYRAGKVVKFSQKGFLFKTHEGQLFTGSYAADPSGGGSTTWAFSVLNSEKEVLADIEKAVDGDYRVKLHYHEKMWHLPWRGDTKYFVYRVERIGQ